MVTLCQSYKKSTEWNLLVKKWLDITSYFKSPWQQPDLFVTTNKFPAGEGNFKFPSLHCHFSFCIFFQGKKLKVGQPEEDAALDEISSDEELDEDELNTSGRRSSSPNVRQGSSPSLPAATNPSFPSPVLEEKGEEGNNNNGDVVKENGSE